MPALKGKVASPACPGAGTREPPWPRNGPARLTDLCDLAEAQRAFFNAPCRDAERRFHNHAMDLLEKAAAVEDDV
ncbi:hypothetical protein [Streptomyces sp. NPDC058295]|uniref:hypothetical protein n=1 Tax=Streptomyces sp. NPDC058295 TaxID=3346431 RepID=UPI0036E62D3D